jgi:deoxyribose-phosphate aldolase
VTLSANALAKYIDHALLQPDLTDSEFDSGCELAKRWGVATVCVKSADVRRAEDRTRGSGVAVCAVVGFPHANAPTEIIGLEAARALGCGATEIDLVVNLARVLSDDWAAVRAQIDTVNTATVGQGGLLKVIFETGLIRDRERKTRLCAVCRELNVAFVKTSTGFAFGRNVEGTMTSLGATIEDVRLLVEHAGPTCRVKASGGIRSLHDALAYIRAGAARLGTTSTERILLEASKAPPTG